MIVYSLLLCSVLLAILSLRLIWRSNNNGNANRLLNILLAGSLALFIYLYGTWVFLSVYIKYIFAVSFIALLLYTLINGKHNNDSKIKPRYIRLLPASLLTLLCTLYFTGTIYRPYRTINLAFPFKHGTYFVFQGGRGLPTNLFHFSFRGAVFAMDLVKLNKYGNRANSVFSKNVNDYEIFGDTIYSPCSGVVMSSKDENPDNIPPNRERGPSNTNHVLLANNACYVFMGHMKHNAVFVREGDTVTTGQPLGLAGNSGFSLEPHLHIQVHERTTENMPWYKEKQLSILFGRKSYLLFDEIKAN